MIVFDHTCMLKHTGAGHLLLDKYRKQKCPPVSSPCHREENPSPTLETTGLKTVRPVEVMG